MSAAPRHGRVDARMLIAIVLLAGLLAGVATTIILPLVLMKDATPPPSDVVGHDAPWLSIASPNGPDDARAEHAWIVLRGRAPASSRGGVAPDFPTPLQPASVLHASPDGVAPSLLLPRAPDALAAWKERVVFAYPDIYRSFTKPTPTPPRETSVSSLRATLSERGWQVDTSAAGIRSLPGLPGGRGVIDLAFAGVTGEDEPVLLALLGPAVDIPARAPSISLTMLLNGAWTELTVPWDAGKTPRQLVGDSRGCTLLVAGPDGDEFLLRGVPRRVADGNAQEPQGPTPLEAWKLYAPDEGPSLFRPTPQRPAPTWSWTPISLPERTMLLDDVAILPAGGPAWGLIAARQGQDIDLWMRADEAEATGWQLLATLEGVADRVNFIGVPNGHRIAMAWTEDRAGTLEREAVIAEVSLATGAVLRREPFKLPLVAGSDGRFVSLAVAYVLCLVMAILLPTPQGGGTVPAGTALASPMRRFVAGLLDVTMAFTLGSLLAGREPGAVLTQSVVDLLLTGDGQATLLAILGVGTISGTVLETLTGRSVGKALTGIGVARLSTDPQDGALRAPTLYRSFLRNLVKWWLFPLGMGPVLRAGTSHRGDLMARCAVIDPSVDEEPDEEV